jgi:23S rRNA (guanosine2251-2'-O)-methyltransferase
MTNSTGYAKKDILFGIHPVISAIKAGKSVSKLLLQQGASGEGLAELRQLANESGIPVQMVPVVRLNKLSAANHQGVIAFISQMEFHQLEDIIPAIFERGEVPLLVVLDQITDVRNMGAIARSAECAGAHALIVPEKGSAEINGDAIKTSAGALMKIPVCRVRNLKISLHYLRQSGIQLIACTEKGNRDLFHCDFKLPLAIIMGNEQTGISPEVIRIADQLGKIPMSGTTGSLNVSVAAGVFLFEAVRQRAKGE